jgi:hypothetical protein
LASCATPTPLPVPPETRSTGETAISFQVAPLVRLRVTSEGPIAAATNTGCAPRATDGFVVGDRAATAAEAAAAIAAFRSGDWRTPGAWHPADR